MTKIYKTLLLMNSLTVYRGILERSVIKSYMKLLSRADKPAEEFLSAYGEFYSALSDRDITDNLARYITEAALFDENRFSVSAAGGNTGALSKSVIDAVKNDCEIINSLASLTADDILSEYKFKSDIPDIIEKLPRWSAGEPVAEFKNGVDIEKLSAYYKKNGFGIYARYKAFIWRDGDIKPVGNPDKIKAVIPATGPGTDVTVIPFSIQSLTRSSPGSDIAGVPASLTWATFLPSFRSFTIYAPFSCLLCS